MRLVTIEFTQDTKNADGDIVRTAGTVMRVDPMSAKSFVEVKKVAKLAGPSAEKAEAQAKAAKTKTVTNKTVTSPPEPPVEPVEPVESDSPPA